MSLLQSPTKLSLADFLYEDGKPLRLSWTEALIKNLRQNLPQQFIVSTSSGGKDGFQ